MMADIFVRALLTPPLYNNAGSLVGLLKLNRT